jgi:thiamine-triphosphatase
MIEVEKKFDLTIEQEQKLLDHASFINEKTFTDTYFDTHDYLLSKKDIWLRKRDEKFELKVPLNDPKKQRISDQYQEIENDSEIADFLKIPTDKNLEEVLVKNQITPFCTITTIRRKYKKDKFIIDIDNIDFGLRICEIELMVNDVSEIEKAQEEIIKFAQNFGLSMNRTRGKVLEYLKIHNPEHLRIVEEATRY